MDVLYDESNIGITSGCGFYGPVFRLWQRFPVSVHIQRLLPPGDAVHLHRGTWGYGPWRAACSQGWYTPGSARTAAGVVPSPFGPAGPPAGALSCL